MPTDPGRLGLHGRWLQWQLRRTALERRLQPGRGLRYRCVTITTTAPGTKDDQGKALVLQANDRVPTVRAIQAGDSNDSNHDFTLIRLSL